MSESEFNDYNEIIYERDKLKEQNEKLKEAITALDVFIDFCSDEDWTPAISGLKEYKNLIEVLKSCEP